MSTPDPTTRHPGSAAAAAVCQPAGAGVAGSRRVARHRRAGRLGDRPVGECVLRGVAERLGAGARRCGRLRAAVRGRAAAQRHPGHAAADAVLKPNHNPGAASPIPTVGAARPSAPIFALDPRLSAQPPAAARDQPRRRASTLPLATTPSAPPVPSAPVPEPSFARDTDLAALPGRLQDTRSLVPTYDAPSSAPFAASSAATSEPLYFLTDNPALARPSTPRRRPPCRSVQSLDLGALAPQHRPDVALGDLPGTRAVRCQSVSSRLPDPAGDASTAGR